MSTEFDRLLIVDDQPDVANVVKAMADEIGYVARVVERSADFESVLSQWRPTVVLLDIIMPERDGLELLGALQQLNFQGALIMMSGADPIYLNMAASSAKARGLNLVHTLSKPFRKEQLQGMLQALRRV